MVLRHACDSAVYRATAGDRQGVPDRVLAPQRGLDSIDPYAQLACLSPSEVDTLAQLYESIRGCSLNHYIAEVREFLIEEWSAEQLGQVYATSELDASGEDRYQPFAA